MSYTKFMTDALTHTELVGLVGVLVSRIDAMEATMAEVVAAINLLDRHQAGMGEVVQAHEQTMNVIRRRQKAAGVTLEVPTLPGGLILPYGPDQR